jgi:penicillin-binding protein 1C
MKYGQGKRYASTIKSEIQKQLNQAVERHISSTRWDEIHNAAAIVIEVSTGNVLAYVGNTSDPSNSHGNQVDIVQAPRSTGSILKPFLYAAMLDDGLMLPNTLYPDIPLQYEAFAPKNFSEEYDGAVPASEALSRSLNVPSVVMLRDYSYTRFYHLLQRMGFSQLNQPSDHYGLSIILGGAEASLWDIGRIYASMARTLNDWTNLNGSYDPDRWNAGQWIRTDVHLPEKKSQSPPFLSAGSIWSTYEALLRVNRPDEETGWENFANSRRIAWKTGTSFGNRDAWAVGTTPEYVVAVWVGNHDGIGRPSLTGTRSAAPLMFDIFRQLGNTGWFATPYDDMAKVAVCSESGMKPGSACNHVDSMFVPSQGIHTQTCTYHSLLHLSDDGRYQVSRECSEEYGINPRSWFSLPAVQAHYYRKGHPGYKDPPPFAPGCEPHGQIPIGLIYPKSDLRILISRGFDGEYIPAVLEAAHTRPDAKLFWHIDDQFAGQTSGTHKLSVLPESGRHKLTVTDESGAVLEKWIEVVRN